MPVKRRLSKQREGAVSPQAVAAYEHALAMRKQHARGELDLDAVAEADKTVEQMLSIKMWQPSVFGLDTFWEPSDDPQEVLDEALVWAAKSDCVEAFPVLVGLGARVDADPYRGTALAWAAVNGRVRSVRMLVELGADPNHRGSFGGPSHGEGVTAIHLAAQAGRRDTVVALLDLGADPLIVDRLHGGTALGWARFGGHGELSEVLP